MSGVYHLIIKNGKLQLSYIALSLSLLLWTLSCSKGILLPNVDSNQKITEIILQWNKLYLELDRYTDEFRPPISSRSLAYISLIAYETSVPSMEGYKSLGLNYKGLKLPTVPFKDKYELSLALNKAYATAFNYYFKTTQIAHLRKIDILERNIENTLKAELDPKISEISIQYGESVANAITQWSSTDEVGHEACYHLFDDQYQIEPKDGSWAPSELHPSKPLLPHWGSVRPFVIDLKSLSLPTPMPYSEEPGSKMYLEAVELVSLSSPLSEDNKWVAEFWSDDHHNLSFSPAARWLSITNQIIEHESPSYDKVLETYLRVGFALCDALIATWKTKYEFSRERPEQYIKRVINKSWHPYHDSPSFPTFPSGHAALGAAVSEVLSKMYGEVYEFTDCSHMNRTEFNGKPRSYHSFHQMAYDNAFSRIAMGVHFKNDCEEGLKLGFSIGDEVSKLQIHSEQDKSLSVH